MTDRMHLPLATDRLYGGLERRLGTATPKNAKEVGEQVEAMFLNMMFSKMRESMAPEGLFGDGNGGEIFQSLFDQHLGEASAKRHQLGIAAMIEREIERRQNPADAGPVELGPLPPRGAPVRREPVRPAPAQEVRKLGPIDDATLQRYIADASAATGLSPRLIAAVIDQESGGNPDVVSSKGAIGLMQIMPKTGEYLGMKDIRDPEENVLTGSGYLRRMIDRFGSLELGLAAYNAGPGNVERYGGIPPFAETQNYVKKILARLKS